MSAVRSSRPSRCCTVRSGNALSRTSWLVVSTTCSPSKPSNRSSDGRSTHALRLKAERDGGTSGVDQSPGRDSPPRDMGIFVIWKMPTQAGGVPRRYFAPPELRSQGVRAIFLRNNFRGLDQLVSHPSLRSETVSGHDLAIRAGVDRRYGIHAAVDDHGDGLGEGLREARRDARAPCLRGSPFTPLP